MSNVTILGMPELLFLFCLTNLQSFSMILRLRWLAFYLRLVCYGFCTILGILAYILSKLP